MTVAEFDAVLGIIQTVFIVLIFGVAVWAVWFGLYGQRRRQLPDNALQTVRNDHDWNCATGKWPHAGDCVPKAGSGWFGQVALEDCQWLLGNVVRPAARKEDERCGGE